MGVDFSALPSESNQLQADRLRQRRLQRKAELKAVHAGQPVSPSPRVGSDTRPAGADAPAAVAPAEPVVSGTDQGTEREQQEGVGQGRNEQEQSRDSPAGGGRTLADKINDMAHTPASRNKDRQR